MGMSGMVSLHTRRLLDRHLPNVIHAAQDRIWGHS